MIDNPLAGLVPHIAPRERPVQPSWAVVSGLNPLRVTLPGADGPAAFSPLSLVPLESLSVGQKVRVEWMGRTALLTHRTYGTAADAAAEKTAAEAAAAEAARKAWKVLTAASPWTSYSQFGELAYRLEGDVVRLTGAVRYGSGTVNEPFTTLPVEARPRSNRLVTMTTADGGALGYVTSTGAIYLHGSIPTGSWVSVEGITYRL